jgi:hypothetical protein
MCWDLALTPYQIKTSLTALAYPYNNSIDVLLIVFTVAI